MIEVEQMSPGVQAGLLDLLVVSLKLAHKYQTHLPGIQQDSFESFLAKLIHKYRMDFFEFHWDISTNQINLDLAHSFHLDFYDIQ
jgi:hypothetical protein